MPDGEGERRRSGGRVEDAIFTYLDALHSDLQTVRSEVRETNRLVAEHNGLTFHPGGAEMMDELRSDIDVQWASLHLDQLTEEQRELFPAVILDYAVKLKERKDNEARAARRQHLLTFAAGLAGNLAGVIVAVVVLVAALGYHK